MKDTYLNFLTSKIQNFITRFIEFRNDNKLDALFTLDAGENVHIIYDEKSDKIKSFLNYYPCIALLESNKVNYHFSFNKDEIKLYNNKKFYRKCILISGKRYSGKTFLATKLNHDLGYPVFNLSDQIKKIYCQENEIDYNTILNDRKFKEKHRFNLIKYAEEKIKIDKFFWCKKLFDTIPENCRIFILSDARRINDINYFSEMTNLIKIRINCDKKVRANRGFKFNLVDSLNSEIGLDDYNKWNIISLFNNLNDYDILLEKLKLILIP